MRLKDQVAIVIGGAYSLATDNPCLDGEVVRRDAAVRMTPR